MRAHLVWVPGYHSFPKWAIGWWPGKLLHGLKTLQLIFWDFNCHLNICCLRVNITLIVMSSSSNELIHAFVVKLWHLHTKLYKFGQNIVLDISHMKYQRPFKIILSSFDSFPRFSTLCIEWFGFLFLMTWQWKQRISCPGQYFLVKYHTLLNLCVVFGLSTLGLNCVDWFFTNMHMSSSWYLQTKTISADFHRAI